MKYYFYAAIFISLATLLVVLLPFIISFPEQVLVGSQIPKSAGAVAGVQKINNLPVSKGIKPPPFSARAVLIKDLAANAVLFQENGSSRLPIASVTKIMTALLASEYFKANQPLAIGDSASVAGSKAGLIRGEVLTFRSILYAMLLNSGNDAAFAVAENYPGGVLGFVSQMNKKAISLNLPNTHFDNPAGFDSPNHYSSAYDMAAVTQEALKDDQLSRIFATKNTEVMSVDKKFKHPLRNLNVLLSKVSGVLGVKTGYTEGAKENLVTLVDRRGHKLLVIVLGSDDRFGESTKLIEWSYDNFIWPDSQTAY